MKNAFYLTLKSIFILERFKFLLCLFDQVENLIGKTGLISKIYDVTTLKADNCNTHIGQQLKE